MRLSLSVLLIFLSVACSTTGSSRDVTEGSSDRPVWVNDPADFCGEQILCAVGEGISFVRAESEARKNLAKIFKVEVSGTTNINEESHSLSNPGFLQSQGVSEDVEISTREVVDEVLEGVVTSKKHQEDGTVYALAQLDKATAIRLVRPRIKDLDSEIEQNYESGRRSLLPRALELDARRSGLKSFTAILGIPSFSTGVTRADLLKRKAQFDADPRFIRVEDHGRWPAIAEAVRGELISLGYKISKEGAYDFKLVIEDNARREYLNVKGFERYHVNVKISSLDRKGLATGGVAFERAENGRSLAQIRANVLENFREYLRDQFSQLQLD